MHLLEFYYDHAFHLSPKSKSASPILIGSTL